MRAGERGNLFHGPYLYHRLLHDASRKIPSVLDFRAKEDAMRIMLLLAVLLGGLVAWEPICRPGPCVPKPVCPYWKITC